MVQPIEYVLVTGATGFIGAHVVDELLRRGLKVRGATRSLAKGQAMMNARPGSASTLDFVQIDDFTNPNMSLDDAVQGVDAVIHVASPLTYNTVNNEEELILPAIKGVQSILEASANANIHRVVLTSSFASVMDVNRTAPPYFTYTGADWNPLSYEEAIAPTTPAHIAYRGAKKFAEKAAWDFAGTRKPSFDIVTLCPSMTFGPIVHPVTGLDKLNESTAMLWKVAQGEPLATARVPFWIDVRDLATAHVEALLRPEAGGKRYVVGPQERFSYDLAAGIMEDEFEWARGKVQRQEQVIDVSHGIDGDTATAELGFKYRSFKETVVDLVTQISKMQDAW